MINKLPRYFKINVVVILLCALSILGLSIGYSILSYQYTINTNVLLALSNDISITSIGNMSSVSNAYEVNNISHTTNTITSNVGLPDLDSSISYLVTISNNTNVTKELSDIVYTSDNDNIIYTLSDLTSHQIIEAGNNLTFTITYSYDSNITSVPSIIEDTSLLEFVFSDYIKINTPYVSDNMILNLSGEDTPVNNKWIDRVDGKQISLTDVLYDDTNMNYDFSKGGYGKYPSALIPSTGDFTIETLVILPDKLTTTDDQAIVSQMSGEVSNTLGRFKLNYAYSKSKYSLLVFNNETTTNTNTFNYFSTNVVSLTSYLIQLVRTGSQFLLYLNGTLINKVSFPITNQISNEPFKIARWSNSTPQSFLGKINTIRIYDTALTSDQLFHNYTIDYEKYINPNISKYKVKDYLLSNSLVTTNSGLYLEDNGIYRFKGDDIDNYAKFNDSPDLYRIISINNDTMKLINISQNINIPFDESDNRNKTESPFCDQASMIADQTLNQKYGCSAFSSNGTTVKIDSSINKYLNNNYYESLPNSLRNHLITQNISCGRTNKNAKVSDIHSQISKTQCLVNIGLLSIEDVLNSSITNIKKLSEGTKGSSYLFSLPSNTMSIWTINGTIENTYDVWTIIGNTGLSKRRGSRYNQTNTTPNLYFYAFPVIEVSSLLMATGIGSSSMPFIIEY